MKMPNITPGPWRINENTTRTTNGSWFEIDGRMVRIAEIPASTNPMWDIVTGYREGKANSTAIAALPDLLEALIEADIGFEAEGYEPDGPTRGPIRAALLKAGCTDA